MMHEKNVVIYNHTRNTQLTSLTFRNITLRYKSTAEFKQCDANYRSISSAPKYPSDYMSVPDSKVHGAIMGPIWGRQDPGGPHVGPMNFAIRGNFTDGMYLI